MEAECVWLGTFHHPSVTPKMRERIAKFLFSIKKKELNACFSLFVWYKHLYIFLSSQPPKIRLNMDSVDIFGLILAKSCFPVKRELFHTLQCVFKQYELQKVNCGISSPEVDQREAWEALPCHSLLHIVLLLWALWFYFLPYSHFI